MESLIDFYNLADSFKWEHEVTVLSSWKYMVGASLAYLATIFALRYGTSAPTRLTNLKAVHNLFLCILSVAMLAGVLSEAFFALKVRHVSFRFADGLKISYHKFGHGKMEFWVWVFHLSKIYEFLDTVFIALEHKPLEFLHVYHHVLTLFVTWFGLYTDTTFQWMGVATNAFVHTLMYFYYFASTFGYRPWWKKYLTQLQMIQFWFNTAVLILWIVIKHYFGVPCIARTESIVLVTFANITFFMLFARFYKRTYNREQAPTNANLAKKKL